MPSTNGHGPKSEGVGRVALCLRVSSEEQRERQTIETQRAFLGQYCRLYELEVAEIYADDGVSGTIPLHERPEGRRLLEDAQAGKFETLLAYRLDRLGRSLLVIVDAHDRLQAAGVSLRSATEPIDTSTPSGRLIFQMLASFAEYERETIRERTRDGMHRAFRDGKYMGRVPYGYRLNGDARLEVVAEEAAFVREIIANIAEGSTLYREAKRLNDLGLPSPGQRYANGVRKPGRSWSATTISNIVHQPAYSGIHKVKFKGDEEHIEREVPAITDPSLQERAKATLTENKRRPDRKGDRKYLLAGLVKCAVCGFACVGHSATARGKKYHYYRCIDGKTEKLRKGPPHPGPFLNAEWLEDLVWQDVRRFLENPGEILERVREQHKSESDNAEELAVRREDLAKRLAAKQSEKDRYVRLYAQGHLSESELETYLTDLKNQTDNLRLLIESVEADLSHSRERTELADTTHAWLATLRDRLAEVEEDTPEAFEKRRHLVRLLVQGITLEKDEAGQTRVHITYRFDPPHGRDDGDSVVGGVPNPTSFSKAKQATAPAVYGPMPGSPTSTLGSEGTSPSNSSTRMRAVRCRFTTRL